MVVRSGLTPTSRRGRRASPGNRPRSGSRPWWSVRQRFLTSTKSPIEAPISCPRLGREVRAAAGTASQHLSRRSGTESLRSTIGAAAKLTVEDGRDGVPRFRSYKALQCGASLTHRVFGGGRVMTHTAVTSAPRAGLPFRPGACRPASVERSRGPARAQPRARFDVGGDRPEPSYVRVCRRVPLVDAANGDAIIEDDPVLKVGHRWGTFEISRSQRKSHSPERLRARRPGTAPAPRA